jgi:hypothetical protein
MNTDINYKVSHANCKCMVLKCRDNITALPVWYAVTKDAVWSSMRD